MFYEIVKKHFKDKKDINSEKIFFEIGNVLKSYEYKDGSKIKGIPYGGIVESHIFANILLLNKIQKIIQVINETLKAVGDTNSRVLDFVTYADDSIILFRNSSKNNDKVISNLKKLVDEIKMHDFGDGSKTRILELNSAREKLRNEYLTPSSINAMFEVVKRSENRLIFDHEQTDTLKENIFFKESYKLLLVKLDKWIYLPSNDVLREVFQEVKKWKRFEYFVIELLKKFNSTRDIEKIWNIVLFVISSSDSNDVNQIELDFSDNWSSFKVNDVLSLVTFACLNLDYHIFAELKKNLDNAYKKLSSKTSDLQWLKHDIDIYIESLNNVYSNQIFLDSLNKISVEESSWVESYSRLVTFIANYGNLSVKECDFLKIDEFYAFNINVNRENEPIFWKKTKISFLMFFNKVFEKRMPLLYLRFKRFLLVSENRNEFIEYMHYLNSTLTKRADLNEQAVDKNDNYFFELISKSFSIEFSDSLEQNIHVDKLFLTRIFVKILWLNGSISTNLFTSHDHSHGDVLLSRFHEIRASSRFFRSWFRSDSVDMFSLIASFYLHDIGMLIPPRSNEFFYGEFKDIVDKIAQNTRMTHGTNSALFVLEEIGKFLDFSAEVCGMIANATIAHQNGFENILLKNDKDQKNAVVLSLVDLLDVTYERSWILSRKMVGKLASNVTLAHWLKHYATKNILIREQRIKSEDGKDVIKIIIKFFINTAVIENSVGPKASFSECQKLFETIISQDTSAWFAEILRYIEIESNQKITHKVEFELLKMPENHKISFFGNNSKVDAATILRIWRNKK